MQSRVQWTVAGCFAVFHQLCSIRRSVPSSVFQTLVDALVLPKLDYGNATLVGLPPNLLNHLQSVLNASARSIAGLRCSPYITETLASFHWLHAPQRINFKLAVNVYRALYSTVLRYLSNTLNRVADILSQCHLHSSTSSQLMVRRSPLVTVGERSFTSVSPRLQNGLPDNIMTTSSLSDFRRKLKTYLIISGYCLVVFLTMADLEVVS